MAAPPTLKPHKPGRGRVYRSINQLDFPAPGTDGDDSTVGAAGEGLGRFDPNDQRRLLSRPVNSTDVKAFKASEGLMAVLDWLAPEDAPHRRGSLLGFDARHSRGHIHRAILEAIALTMERNSRAMEEALVSGDPQRFTRVTVSGGGAQSDLMMQIMADVYGLPAARAAGGADRGAAICAAVGTGVAADFAEAAAAMVPETEVWVPNPQRQAYYRRLGELHRRITGHTDQFYRELAELDPG